MAHIVGPENMSEFYKLIARRLNRIIPADAVLFRSGENQFGVLLQKTTTNKIEKLSADLKNQLVTNYKWAILQYTPNVVVADTMALFNRAI